MNKDLEKAIKDGQKEASKKEKLKQNKILEEKARAQNLIKSQIPAARKWVKETFFHLIKEAESINSKYLWLSDGSHADHPGIETKAIIEAIKEVDGLTVRANWVPYNNDPEAWESGGYYRYYITWRKE